MENNYVLKRIPVDQIIDLRHQELRQGLPRETAQFEGDHDEGVVHYAAFVENDKSDQAVCCLTLLPSKWGGNQAYQLRGMATLATLQGKGIGAQLAKYAQDDIRQITGVREFWCNARESAIGFYEKLGWRVVSEKFDIEGVGPHCKMHYVAD